jgi:hypothetical protein
MSAVSQARADLADELREVFRLQMEKGVMEKKTPAEKADREI